MLVAEIENCPGLLQIYKLKDLYYVYLNEIQVQKELTDLEIVRYLANKLTR